MFRSGPKWLIYQECSFIQRSIYVECTVLYYVQIFFVIERTRDLNYLKFVATDFSQKTISPSAGENSGDLA